LIHFYKRKQIKKENGCVVVTTVYEVETAVSLRLSC